MLAGDNISDASGINRAGVIVGTSGTFDINAPTSVRSRAVVWRGGKIEACRASREESAALRLSTTLEPFLAIGA